MEIIRFSVEHLFRIRAQEHQASVLSAHLTSQYAEVLEAGLAYSAVDGADVIACGGIVSQFGGSGTLWAAISDNAGPRIIRLFRTMERIISIAKLRRIEASAEVDFLPGCRCLELIGFQNEGLMRAYGIDGKDHYRYAMTTWQ